MVGIAVVLCPLSLFHTTIAMYTCMSTMYTCMSRVEAFAKCVDEEPRDVCLHYVPLYLLMRNGRQTPFAESQGMTPSPAFRNIYSTEGETEIMYDYLVLATARN
ncbi:hypothetical protein FA95DRAFT_695778 [Auriscalpium vulgare]|uniref:Uncharacterized protein n=1 Tax=Auriscalpium vulgare TaxID=40419 RepID=A0ACB8RCT4_9AGAM|nr:hypothetical protein FA95DRAFT_695778 [Auriscalpium vulgare]